MGGVIREEQLLIGGKWTAAGGAEREVEDPATEQVVGVVREAAPSDVDAAVLAAAGALDEWTHTSPERRADVLDRVADRLEASAEELARLITTEFGAPPPLARSLHVDVPTAVVRRTTEALRRFDFTRELGNSTIRRRPSGVVGAITPWNLPLHQVIVKIIPAIAAGAPVVLKPSTLTPLTAFALGRLLTDAGLPPGVFNLVIGGAAVGEQLASHPLVRHVSFTGSTEVGRRVGAIASSGIKRVTLELGGKSPSVVLADADDDLLLKAVKITLANCFLNTGQTCTALTRLIVPASRLSAVEDIARESARKYAPGARLGPVISAAQRTSIADFTTTEATGGALDLSPEFELPKTGHYVAPRVFSRVDPQSRLAREEVFGPVLAIIAAQDDDEAIRLANDSEYGLAGAVWGSSIDRARQAAERIQAGQVDINGAAFNPGAPFGGYKRSGVGREIGWYGIEDALETQSIQA